MRLHSTERNPSSGGAGGFCGAGSRWGGGSCNDAGGGSGAGGGSPAGGGNREVGEEAADNVGDAASPNVGDGLASLARASSITVASYVAEALQATDAL